MLLVDYHRSSPRHNVCEKAEMLSCYDLRWLRCSLGNVVLILWLLYVPVSSRIHHHDTRQYYATLNWFIQISPVSLLTKLVENLMQIQASHFPSSTLFGSELGLCFDQITDQNMLSREPHDCCSFWQKWTILFNQEFSPLFRTHRCICTPSDLQTSRSTTQFVS